MGQDKDLRLKEKELKLKGEEQFRKDIDLKLEKKSKIGRMPKKKGKRGRFKRNDDSRRRKTKD